MLKLTYGFDGKVASVSVLAIGGYELIPINLQTLVIDWTFYTYAPTRESIKAAWDTWAAGKSLSFELRNRPDLVPLPQHVEPNWDKLAKSILVGDLNPLYVKITTASLGTVADDSIVKLRNLNNIAVAAGKIDQAVRVEKDESALAASFSILFSSSNFVLTQDEKNLWNTTTASLGFTSIIQL